MVGTVGKKVAIMQPYFFPYIGYFQLISNVDNFIVYDEIQFSKQSWVTRNYIMDSNGSRKQIGLSVKRDSDYLNINERYISDSFDSTRLLNSINHSYRASPNFSASMDLLQDILSFPDRNLFNFLFNSINKVANYIEIETNISKSSDVEGKVNTRSQERVISICEKTDAKVYINPIGGLELYSREDFSSCGVSLQFLKAKQTPYRQIFGGFEPSLSIIDLLMNLSKEQIKTILSEDFEIK
jgi:hypothetical protein